MSSTGAVPHAVGYRGYWVAWGILLVLTVVMINIHSRSVLLGGIAIKSAVIGWWFMHLNHEKKALVWTVLIGGLGFVALMWGLLSYDSAHAWSSV